MGGGRREKKRQHDSFFTSSRLLRKNGVRGWSEESWFSFICHYFGRNLKILSFLRVMHPVPVGFEQSRSSFSLSAHFLRSGEKSETFNQIERNDCRRGTDK